MNEPRQSPTLMDQVRDVLRVRRYALRIERACCDRIRRHVKFHGMTGRQDLAEGTRKVEEFLTHLALEGSSHHRVVTLNACPCWAPESCGVWVHKH